MRRPIFAAAAAVAMLGMSSGALARSAAPLSLAAHLPAGTATQDASQIRGGFILPTLAIILIGVLIYVAARGTKPRSP